MNFHTNTSNNTDRSTTNTQHVPRPCPFGALDFNPLGGSRADAAVVACSAVWMYDSDVNLPPDVVDTSLTMLCAPLTVTYAADLQDREAHFRCPAATVRLRTNDAEVSAALQSISASMDGGLSVTVLLAESINDLPDGFMRESAAVQRLDLGRTSLQKIGDMCLYSCINLTAVILPPSLTAVGGWFLRGCRNLQHVDMQHTALHTLGGWFGAFCFSLTTVALPDTVTEVGHGFLSKCGRVEVLSGSTAAQISAAEHNNSIGDWDW